MKEKWFSILLFMLLITNVELSAKEFFVSRQGNDNNDGLSMTKSFATIQKGVEALSSGDILTIGPGEYLESVKRDNLGSADKETVIRAAIPGTVLLRGGVPAPEFRKIENYRFVYGAPFKTMPQALMEVDTLNVIDKHPNIPDIEMKPGSFYYDTAKKMLYISSSDMLPPSRHLYRVSVIPVSGLWLVNPQRVIIDGISATGFHTTVVSWSKSSVWGIRLDNPIGCVIRNCTAFLNSGGIGLYGGGKNNIVENCVAYGNFSQNVPGGGIRRFGGDNDVIRNCYAYRSKRRGISFYGLGKGPVLLKNNISWGHILHDFRIKGHGKLGSARAENCVAIGNGMVHDIYNSLVGENGYRTGGMSPDNILHSAYVDSKEREFADPENLDFRLQSTSQIRGAGENGADAGPFQYKENIFYISPDGDDSRPGTSVRLGWKTIKYALSKLKKGDTLYLEPGVYKEDLTIAGNGITIRGRRIEPVILSGSVTIKSGTDISLERINFTSVLNIDESENIEINNCTFKGLDAGGTKNLKINHCVFSGKADFKKCGGLNLCGNIYADGVDMAGSEIIYSDYNSYSAAGTRDKMPDKYSLVMKPEIILQNDVPMVKNNELFKGRGPNGTAIGIYIPYRKKAIKFAGPFLHSSSNTTANIECWSSLAAVCEIAWGETPECKYRQTLNINGFASFSLTGLAPGKKYYVRVLSVEPAKNNYNLVVKGIKPKDAGVTFTTSMEAPKRLTYYVAPDGDDANSGLERSKSLRTISCAAGRANCGDTVLVAGGTYKETVFIRATGDKGNPVTFKAIPGEKAILDGARKMQSRAFIATNKKYLKFDSFYLGNYKIEGWSGVFYLNKCDNVQITRCFMDGRGPGGNPNLFLYTNDCLNILVKNCVIFNGFYGIYSKNSDLRIENTVNMRNWIEAIIAAPGPDRKLELFDSIITDSTPFKVKVHLFQINRSKSFIDKNNCYYLRKPDEERKMFLFYGDPQFKHLRNLKDKRMSLAEYKKKVRATNSFVANPWFKATVGMKDDGKMGKYAKAILVDSLVHKRELDFPDLFATNPELVKRGIGLQPEAFKDFHFNKNKEKTAESGKTGVQKQ